MSSGKKKHPKKRMYSEGEVRKGVRQAADDAVKRIMLLCIVAARDIYDMNDDEMVKFMETMQRYINYEKEGLIDLTTAAESLKKHGVNLELSRW